MTSVTTGLMILLISCKQVVESLKQHSTKPTGCVWCQRAHPDTGRVKTENNVKVSAIEYSCSRDSVSLEHLTQNLIVLSGYAGGMLRTDCGVSRVGTYKSTGLCLVSTCASGYKPSKEQTKCESERTSDDEPHNTPNDIIDLSRTGCGVSRVVQYDSKGECLVSTCSSGYKSSKDKTQCESECN